MPNNSVSIKEVLDSGKFTLYQIWICTLCFLLAFFDGFDLSLVGVALPDISEYLNSTSAALGVAMSAGNVGALIGAFILGMMADRFGRKNMLLVSAFTFGIFTLAIAFIQSVEQLIFLRFIAGLGLGGAVPNALAFGSEYAPSKKRATLATTMYAGVAIGATFAGLFASYFLPRFGWQSLFLAGGTVACLIGIIALISLPESLEFLVKRNTNIDKSRIRKIVSRIAPLYGTDNNIDFVSSEKRLAGVPFKHLFKDGRTANTILLWMAFILSYYLLWLILSWTPTLLKKSGASSQEFSLAFACVNMGAVFATVLIGILMDKFNPLKILKIGFFLAFISVFIFGYFASSSFIIVAVFSAIMGFFVIGSNSGLMGLAAISYPADIRGTGLGWATGVGRAGSLLAPVAGGLMLTGNWSVNYICTTNAILALVVILIIFIMQKVNSK
ncbi:MAG: MFS transporter [Desulfatiglans sp.]|jgi:AAHS family 4-hydroxybenzoate transporter-like MFS transporter|nr:MFS transporter [Desulfatiglans sp.]